MNKILLRWRGRLSSFLVCTMLFTMLPLTPTRVYGAETSDLGNNDVFSALGFDTSDYPEGYDPDSTENPYGKDLVTANEVFEAFIFGGGGYRLAGHNTSIKPENITSFSLVSKNFPGSEYRSPVSGDFNGDGLAGEMAYVTAVGGNLHLYFVDSAGGLYGPITLNTGEVGHYTAPGPMDWVNLSKIASGDFDGDGYSEIAVYVPEKGKARVDVYKYQKTSGSGQDGWKTPGNWAMVWSHALSSSSVAPNLVSLCAGDINRDGIDDLAVSYGFAPIYGGYGGYTASKAVALFGSKTAMLQTRQSLSLGGSDMYRAAFAYGDLDGDGAKELVVGSQPFSDLGSNKKRSIGVYGYDGSSVVLLSSSVMDVVSGEYIDAKWVSSNGFDGKYLSLPRLSCNIAVIAPHVKGEAYIYLDSVLYSYDDGAFEIKYELEDPDTDGNGTNDSIGWEKVSNTELSSYFEYGACSGDVSGSGTQGLISFFRGNSTDMLDLNLYEELRVLFGKDEKLVKNSLAGGGFSACFPNTDKDDTVLMRYTGEHYIMYTDPKVLAVISSAPYFKDVADSDDSYLDSLETSFGDTTGTGSSNITTVGFETGGYYALDTGVFQFEIAGGFTFEWEREIANSTEYTVSFSTPGGEDSVAFYSIPTEVYVYELSVPDGKGGYTSTQSTVKIPHTAAVQVLRLDYYKSIASDYKDELPDISGEVLTHTLGDPSTYPSSTDGYNVISQYKGDWAGLSFGQGSISQEISITREESDTFNFGAALSVRLGGGTAKNKGGWYLNFNAGGGYSKVDIKGTSFGGTIKNMPVSLENYGYYFAWKLFSYGYTLNKGKDGEYSFPVISYLVKDVTSPPELPGDFAQDFEKTTDSQVALTWSYSKPASFFYIYRYFDFPEGGGSYLVGTVPASDYAIKYDSAGKPYKSYGFTDRNLSPYTEYQYQVQTERSKAPPLSGMSGILRAKTKASQGYPQLSIVPGQLTVYPDKNETLMAEVANITDYTGNAAKYQWQKLVDGIWSDLEGATGAALVFSKAGTGDAGYYRCRVNVITKSDNTAFSAYTNAASVGYSKRSVVFGPISAIDTSIGTTLSLTVSNAHSGSGSIPSGTVIFELSSDTNGAEYTYVTEPNTTGKAELDIGFLPQGVYEIKAYYSGNRIFKSGFAESIRYFSGIGSGYWLDVADTVTYGDTVPYNIYMMSRDAGGASSATHSVEALRHEIYVEDSLYTGNVYNSAAKDSIYAGSAGSIMLRVYYDASGTERYTEVPVTIQKQGMTLKIPSANGAANYPIIRKDMEFAVLSGRIAESDSSGFAEHINYTYRNTAGTAVNEADVPKVPGYYSVSGSADAILAANYNITVLDGSYIVTGGTHTLTASMRPFEGLYTGTLYMVSPGTASTRDNTPITSQVISGTRVIFSAVPHAGYTVYDWYINGVAQKNTNTSIACSMYAENTSIQVQFAIKQNTLTYGIAGDEGGTVDCINDENLESGSIVAQGTQLSFRAVPKAGYHFVEWRYTAAGSGTSHSQGIPGTDGSSTYTMTMPSNSVSVYGAFERDSYKLTFSEGLKAVYIGDHDGDSTTPDREIEVASGNYVKGDTTVTLMPRTGYEAEGTSAWLAVGSQGAAADDNGSYTLTITENTYVQMNVVRGEYVLHLGFKDICEGSTITYRINDEEPVTIHGDSYTDPVEIKLQGGSSLYAEVSVGEDCEFTEWIRTADGAGTSIATQEYSIDSVGESFTLMAGLKYKNTHSISLGQLTEAGASYSVSVNGREYTAASSGDSISVIEGSSLSVQVNLPAGKTIGYWNVDGQSLQASSNTYTFENIVENHSIAPIFTSMTYLTVSWPQVSTAINGCTVIPEDGYLTLLSAGSSFKFKLSSVEGMSVGGVYTNGVLLTPDGAGVYTISGITRHQVITVVLEDLGITVDGRDIKNLYGPGWTYDVAGKRLNLSSNDLTVRGSMKEPQNTFSMLAGSTVSVVIFDNLTVSSRNTESSIICSRPAGLTVILKGSNKAEMIYDAQMKLDNQYVFNAKKLTFSSESTGSMDISIDFPQGSYYPTSVHGILAESLVINGGTINVFSKNYMERDNHNDDHVIYGIKATGQGGIAVNGGSLNIEARADMYVNSAVDGETFPRTFGIYGENGNMTVEGGSVDIISKGSPATAETYGIKLKDGIFKIKGGAVSVDSFSKYIHPCGISVHQADIEGGSLKIHAYSELYTSSGLVLTKSGSTEGSLNNTGGIMELRTNSKGQNLTVAGESSWNLGNGMVILSGENEIGEVEVTKSEYLASQTIYMKVAPGKPTVGPDAAVSVNGGSYESIYPEEGSTEKTGDGWKYEGGILELDCIGRAFAVKGTDPGLTVLADCSEGASQNTTVQITAEDLHVKQLKLIGKKGSGYTYYADILVKGENTLRNDGTSFDEFPLYIENFVTSIAGDGELSVMNKNAEGCALASYSSNAFDTANQIISAEAGSFLLYGGKSAISAQYFNIIDPLHSRAEIQVPDYGTIRKAEAGSSPEAASQLTGYDGRLIIPFSSHHWIYQHKYLKIYETYTAASISPETAVFDKNGTTDEISFNIAYPKTGTEFHAINTISTDGVPICVSVGGAPAVPVTTGVAIAYVEGNAHLELNRDYLKGLTVGSHGLSIAFENQDVLYATITVKDTTAPDPSAVITITPSAAAGYKGGSVKLSAALSGLANIDDTTLSWILTGASSLGTYITQGSDSKEAILHIGSDEAAASLSIRAQLADYPQFVSSTSVIAVEVPAVKVHVEPEDTTLYYRRAGGNTQQFTAAVTGLNDEDVSQAVDWKLWGNTKLATKINDEGLLTVHYDETGYNGLLEVRAVSKAYPHIVSNVACINLSPDEQEPPDTVTVIGTPTTGGAIISVRAGYGTDLENIDAIDNYAVIDRGMKVVFTAQPNEPDTVCVWEVQGDDDYAVSDDGTVLTLNEVRQDVTVTVSFKPLKFYGITISAGENHSISMTAKTPEAGGAYEVREGGTVEFTVTPAVGFFIEDISAIGGTVSKTYNGDGSYTVKVSNIASDVSVEAVSKAVSFYVSYPSSITGGKITVKDRSYNNVTAESTVPYGTLLTISAEAYSGYESDGLTVNGNAFSSGNTHMVTGNVMIDASFRYVSQGGGGGGGGAAQPSETAGPAIYVQHPSPGNSTIGMEISGQIINGVYRAILTSDMADALLEKAAEENALSSGSNIEITVTAQEDENVVVEMPSNLFNHMAQETDAGIKIVTGTADVRFDANAVDAISRTAAGGSISVSVGTADPEKLSPGEKASAAGRTVYEFGIWSGNTQISDFGGGIATVSIPYDLQPGENPNAVVVYYLGSDGSLKTVQGSYDSLTGMVVFSTGHFSKFVIVYNQVDFEDVKDGDWYKAAVDFTAARGIVSGTARNIYSPESKLTRGQFIVMLMRAYDLTADVTHSDNFADAGNTYYTPYLAAARELGLTEGVGNNLFAPEAHITRQDMAVMLYRILKKLNKLPKETGEQSISGFSDMGEISEYASDALGLFVSSEILSGYGNHIMPASVVTRAQAAQIMYNLLK